MEDQIKESPEMAEFKKKWIGKSVRVTDTKHPHFNTIGDVTGVLPTKHQLKGQRRPIHSVQTITMKDAKSLLIR